MFVHGSRRLVTDIWRYRQAYCHGLGIGSHDPIARPQLQLPLPEGTPQGGRAGGRAGCIDKDRQCVLLFFLAGPFERMSLLLFVCRELALYATCF
jgi:hypothetical protein